MTNVADIMLKARELVRHSRGSNIPYLPILPAGLQGR